MFSESAAYRSITLHSTIDQVFRRKAKEPSALLWQHAQQFLNVKEIACSPKNCMVQTAQ